MHALKLQSLLTNIAATFGRQLAAGLMQLATMAIIARVYGAEGNGVYSLTLMLPILLATFLNMGLTPANVYFLGAQQIAPKTAWRKMLKLYVGLSLLGLLLGGLALYGFAERLFPGIPESLLWYSLAIFPCTLLLNYVSGFFQGLQQFKAFNLILLLQPTLTLCGIALLALYYQSDLFWLLSAYLLACITTLIVAVKRLMPLLHRPAPNDQTSVEPHYTISALRYGLKAHLSNIITFINYKADIFLVNFFAGPVAAGFYVIAVQITERLWLLSSAVNTVLLPRLAQLSHDEQGRKQLTPLVCRWTLMLTLCATLGLLLVAPWLLVWVFGDAFSTSYRLLVYLAPGVVLWGAARVIANDIAARGRVELNFYIALLVLACNLLGNLLLIPKMGAEGAALATSLAYSLDFSVKILLYKHLFNAVSLRQLLLPTRQDLTLFKTRELKSQ